jgi:hypothetical protein
VQRPFFSKVVNDWTCFRYEFLCANENVWCALVVRSKQHTTVQYVTPLIVRFNSSPPILTNTITAMAGNEEEIKQMLVALLRKVDNLSVDVASNSSKVDNLSVDVASNSSKVDALSVDVASNSSKVDALSVEVASLQPGAPRSSPTPATLGNEALAYMDQYKSHQLYKEINEGAFKSPEPFLDVVAMQELRKKKFTSESHLIQWFQPHFATLMKSVSEELGYDVILLNSERHSWVIDPHAGAASRPDGVGIAVELASFKMSETDAQFANPGDNNFGTPASWVLRDSIEFITEWKVSSSLNRALGEGIEYHRRIVAPFKADRNVQNTKNTTDVLVANQTSFMLTRCIDNTARFAYHGKWDSPGSKQALHDFVLGTLWPDAPRQRPWKDVLQAVCKELAVELVTPTTTDDGNCFLGYGSSGRVFRVVRKERHGTDAPHLALKIARGMKAEGEGVASLQVEVSNLKRFEKALNQAGATVQNHGCVLCPTLGYSAILVGPVGESVRPLECHVRAALKSLKRLHEAGLAHGDSRWENAIIVEQERNDAGTCLWLDLQTLEEVTEEEEKAKRFSKDVHVFFSSFHCAVEIPNIAELSSAYLQDDAQLGALLLSMAPIWQKP